jgi:hypothetical protein
MFSVEDALSSAAISSMTIDYLTEQHIFSREAFF